MKMILDERGKKYILKEGQDFQSDLGIVSAEVLSDAEIGDEVKSHLDHSFKIVKPNVNDFIEIMDRRCSILIKKDIGTVLAYTGLGAGSRVVDAGTGAGARVERRRERGRDPRACGDLPGAALSERNAVDAVRGDDGTGRTAPGCGNRRPDHPRPHPCAALQGRGGLDSDRRSQAQSAYAYPHHRQRRHYQRPPGQGGLRPLRCRCNNDRPRFVWASLGVQ